MVPAGQDAPQRDNFLEWVELISNAVASGDSNQRIRSHLKVIAKSAWELAAWLTHANGAKRSDAAFVLDATHQIVDGFGGALIRLESDAPDQCPRCGSRNLDVGFIPELMPRPYVTECEQCGWQSQKWH
jgi:predicted Zn-ribbon and HTH transcriptional regulator